MLKEFFDKLEILWGSWVGVFSDRVNFGCRKVL